MIAAPALLEALDSDDARLRSAAIRALGKIGDECAVPPLASFLSSGNSEAAHALAKIGGQRAIAALVAALSNGRRDWREIDASPYPYYRLVSDWRNVFGTICGNALAEIGEPALPALLEASRSDNNVVRARVADLLGRFDDPAVVNTLERLAEDDDFRVRAAAGGALRQIRNRNQEPSQNGHLVDPEGFFGPAVYRNR